MPATAARRATRKGEVLVLDPETPATNPANNLPLFPGGDEDIVAIGVYRLEPIDEGNLGSLPPESDEETIRRRWGGGIYRVSAKGTDGKFARTRTVTIAGDPKFESADARKRYRNKMLGLVDDDKPPAVPPGGGASEVLTIMSQAHAQQLQMLRLQMDAARQDSLDREARARRESEEARARDREFNATMLAIMKKDDKHAAAASVSPTDLVAMLMQGLKLGQKLTAGAGENAPTDPVTAFLNSLPTVLEHGRSLFAGGGAAGAGQPPAAPAGAATEPGGFAVTGALAVKLRSHVRTLMGKGYSQEQALQIAEAALEHGADQLGAVPNAPAVASPAAASSSGDSTLSEPAPVEPEEVIPPPHRRTPRAKATAGATHATARRRGPRPARSTAARAHRSR